MEVGYREAEAGRGLEAARGRMHADRGWVEWVGGGEEKRAPVLAVHVGCVGGSGQDVVPFQDVVFGWVGGYVGRRVGLDGSVFASELERDQ